MKVAQFWRKGMQVGAFVPDGTKVDPDKTETFKSINAAKRRSRELQKGVLGQGYLVVLRG